MTKQEIIKRIATIEKLIADAKEILRTPVGRTANAIREAAGTERFYTPELKSLKYRLNEMERA